MGNRRNNRNNNEKYEEIQIKQNLKLCKQSQAAWLEELEIEKQYNPQNTKIMLTLLHTDLTSKRTKVSTNKAQS